MSTTSYAEVSQRRVLIIEDNRDGRETLECLVGMWGFEVESAEDGLHGVRKALEWQPDVAIVDIGLPLLDGYEVARRVRATMGNRVFLVALTAYGRPEDRHRALEAGFDAHMTKPANLEELSRLLGAP